MYRGAFPNLRIEPEDVLASGDKVVARVRATGTHQGELMDMPATGKWSTCSSSTSCGSTRTASWLNTGESSTCWRCCSSSAWLS